jgi:flagellar export protein FliJ
MKAFRFRAQAALDLRRREYDEARRVLARATMDLHAARDVHAGAGARLREARERRGRELAGPSVTPWAWYRSWIVRLEHELSVCAQDVAARERDVALATMASRTAQQRLEALERFRDKARDAWERAALAAEQKEIDALATLRHVAALRESAQRSQT